jgi:hypothetical protein
MSGDIPPLPPYSSMAWCFVEAQGQLYIYLYLYFRVLRRIFGPKREEDGSWRELNNDELHSLYSSSNIVTVIK